MMLVYFSGDSRPSLCRIGRLVAAGRPTVPCGAWGWGMENGVSKAGAEAKTDHVVDWLAVCRPPSV
jgi:hypothetical protein